MIDRVELVRMIEWEDSTLGIWQVRDEDDAVLAGFSVLEPRWRDNQPNVSCIPPGEYELRPIDCATHGATWRIVGGTVGAFEGARAVDGATRIGVEPHAGNVRADTRGCPLLGKAFGRLRDQIAVTGSRTAMAEAVALLPRDRATVLRIRNISTPMLQGVG